MKPALYYAIRRNLYSTIVAVTSEKPSRYGRARWWGRDCQYSESTHGNTDDLRGRFATLEAATSMRARIVILADKYEKCRKVLNNEINELYRSEGAEIDQLIKEMTDEQVA